LRFADGGWEDAPEMEREIAAVSYDDIVLAPSLIADIRANVDAFFQQKEIFHRLGFAWRRGMLLIGPPGTGKTMLCKAAANAHPEVRFLYVRDIGQPGCRRDLLRPIFEKARRLAPCILAIEDMDGLIHKENRTTFLNELDGFKNNDGLLIIASSNHPERIDEALLKRPSRFDRVYHIGLPDTPERAEYCQRLLRKSPLPVVDGLDTAAMAEKIAEETTGFTPAFLKEAVLSALLAAAQNGNEQLDEAFGDAILEQVNLLKTYLKKARNPEAFADMSTAGNDIGFRPR
jgi:SpoVK/Ycf46/Vps4 family AAA+-type ATPase